MLMTPSPCLSSLVVRASNVENVETSYVNQVFLVFFILDNLIFKSFIKNNHYHLTIQKITHLGWKILRHDTLNEISETVN